jgi:hypothetical protein
MHRLHCFAGSQGFDTRLSAREKPERLRLTGFLYFLFGLGFSFDYYGRSEFTYPQFSSLSLSLSHQPGCGCGWVIACYAPLKGGPRKSFCSRTPYIERALALGWEGGFAYIAIICDFCFSQKAFFLYRQGNRAQFDLSLFCCDVLVFLFMSGQYGWNTPRWRYPS